MTDPFRPVDAPARKQAAEMLALARHAALAVQRPGDGAPGISRVGFLADGGDGLLLISDLAEHSAALTPGVRAALLIGEPGPKGDALTHPRLSLSGVIGGEDKDIWKPLWLAAHPKAGLWYDFADFRLVRLHTAEALLNGGFGAAHRLGRADLPSPAGT